MRNKLRRLATSVLTCLASVAMLAQQLSVSGNIKDNTGYPVPGAAVMVAGTTQGTVTDFDGNYTLQGVPANGKLTVSFVGFATQTEEVKGRSVIDFTLQDEAKELQEVVAVGYGTVNKRDLTGSVASVKAKDIAAIPVSSASEALTGKMAGVNVSTTEGSPDADVKIRVRGGGSLSQDNSPLYIVDGFPVSSISDIAPSEIESIDVLKDASSTAIYGARGANGVIIVTTKSGKEGKVQVNLNASWGAKKATKLTKVLDPYEYAMYQYEIETKGLSETTSSYGDFHDLQIWKSREGTDYQDEIFGRWGNQLQYNANVSGGTKDMKFNISFAHSQENSIMEGSGFNKDNVNVKINTNLNKWLSLDFQARLANQKIKGLSGGADTNESNAANSIVARSVIFRPIAPLTGGVDDDDEENSSSSVYSPLERLNDTYKEQRRFRQDYNAGLNWKPFSGWTFRTEFGYNWRKNKTDQVWATRATQNSKFGYSGQPQAYFETVEYKSWRNANSITYDNKKLFGKRDHINVVIGQEWSSTSQTTRNHTAVLFPVTFTIDEVLANTAAGTALPYGSDIKADENLLSFFGRVNYTLMDKYLLTVTVRADGSSKFADGNRWGVFPAAAIAWRLLDEDFMEGTREVLQNLKVRVSLGQAGNNRISSGLTQTTYTMGGNDDKAPFFDETRSAQLKHGTSLYNPDLKWETTTTRNVGLDYGFLDGRLSGTLDFYWNTTKDLLMKATIPSGTGYTTQYQNFGQTSNKGIELALNYAIIDNEDLKLNFNFNIGYNKSEIDDLNTDNPYQSSKFAGSTIDLGSGDFRVAEGGKVGEVWGYKYIGVYAPEDGKGNGNLTHDGKNWTLSKGNNKSHTLVGGLAPGAPMFECDENGDPIFQKIGNTVAPVSGGFGVDLQWRGFDFAAFFNYSLGGDVVNGTKLASSFYSGSRKGFNIVDDMRLGQRYTWVDPETGLNLGAPSSSTINALGGAEGVMKRLNEINAGTSQFNPVAATKMVMNSTAIEDGSFLRLNNVTLGYTLKKELTQKWFLEKVRFYVTGYNLYCFTKYSGPDPEVDTNKNPMCPGIDYAAYPKSRSIVAGLNITF